VITGADVGLLDNKDAPSDSSASMQDIPSGDTATTGIAMLQGGIKRTSTLSGPLYIAEVTPASEASGNGDCFPDSVAILAMQSGKQSSLSLRQKLCALVREAYGDWQRYYYGVPNSIELSPEANATQEGVIMWAKAPDGFKDQVQLKGWNTPGARFAGFLENQSKGGQWLNVSDAFFFATILDRDIFVLDTGFRNGGANLQIHLYRSGRARLSQQEVDTLVRDDVFIGADQQAEPGRAILCFYNGRDHFEPSLDRVIPMDAVAPDPLTLKTIRRAMKTLTVRSFLGTCQRVNEGEDPDRHAFELTLSAENLEVLESLGNGDL
jgi:hypothetical protein